MSGFAKGQVTVANQVDAEVLHDDFYRGGELKGFCDETAVPSINIGDATGLRRVNVEKGGVLDAWVSAQISGRTANEDDLDDPAAYRPDWKSGGSAKRQISLSGVPCGRTASNRAPKSNPKARLSVQAMQELQVRRMQDRRAILNKQIRNRRKRFVARLLGFGVSLLFLATLGGVVAYDHVPSFRVHVDNIRLGQNLSNDY